MKDKVFKRILTVLLTAMMIASSVISVSAGETLHAPQTKDGVTKWERIKFGQTAEGDITWRVLKINSTTALVLMDGLVENTTGQAMSGGGTFDYYNSRIKSLLSDTYYNSLFTADQRKSLVETSLDGHGGYKLFILNRADLTNSAYGFSNDKESRLIDNKNNNAQVYYTRDAISNNGNFVGTVDTNGSFSTYPTGTSKNHYIRPAMYINLNADFTYAGTIDSNGNVNATEHLSSGLPNTDSSDARTLYMWVMLIAAVGAMSMYAIMKR